MMGPCHFNTYIDPISNHSEGQWKAILLSDDPARQHWLVMRANVAAATSGLPY